MGRASNAAGTSVFFSLAVRGVGTSEVESLTSYIRRLADAHVTQASWLVSSLAGVGSVSGARRWIGNEPVVMGSGLNGDSRTSAWIVGALIDRTWVQDIARTAILDRAQGLVLQGALRRDRAWCPECLSASEPYDRLLWTFSSYRVCVQHNLELLERCDSCGRGHRPLDPAGGGSHCWHCGQKLSESARRQQLPTLTEGFLTQLVARTERGESIGGAQVRGALLRASVRAGSVRALARVSGLPRGAIYRVRGGRRMRVASLFKIVGPHETLDMALSQSIGPVSSVGPGGRSSGPRLAVDRQVAALRALLEGPQTQLPPLREFAKQHGVSTAVLKLRAGALTSELIRRRREAEHQRRSAGQLAHSQRVRAAVRAVHHRTGRVVRRAVEAELGQPGLLRAPYLSDAYRDECARMGAE